MFPNLVNIQENEPNNVQRKYRLEENSEYLTFLRKQCINRSTLENVIVSS